MCPPEASGRADPRLEASGCPTNVVLRAVVTARRRGLGASAALETVDPATAVSRGRRTLAAATRLSDSPTTSRNTIAASGTSQAVSRSLAVPIRSNTALADVPTKLLTRRFCFQVRKNCSLRQRRRYNAATVREGPGRTPSLMGLQGGPLPADLGLNQPDALYKRGQCCPGKVAPTDGKSLPLNVLWPVLPGNDLKSRGRKWPPERSIPTRHNGG